ncbi:MAG: mechanosensitive ion channel [Thermoplasmatota archaeon]
MANGIVEMLEFNIPLLNIPLKNIIFFILVLIVGYFVTIFASRYVKKLMKNANMSEILSEFARRIVKILLLIFVVAFAVGFLGYDAFAGILGLSVVSGFVLGFALQETLANLAAGFMIAITKPFKKGDFVDIAGTTGVIDSVGISITKLKTPDNKRVIIPNSKVYGNIMLNYTALETRRVDLTIGISYSDHIGQALSVAMDVISSHEKVLKDPSAIVAVSGLGDSSVDLVIRPWVKTEDYWQVYFELTRLIKEAFDKNNISIPFPQRDVHLFQQK